FLKEAKTALVLVDDDSDVVVLDMTNVETEAVESIFAYPYARFVTPPDLSKGKRLGGDAATTMLQWWRLSIAAEISGAMDAATNFTVQYVKERKVFGQPLGLYQAIQHRLAECHEAAVGLHWLLLKSAWS